MKTTNGGVTWSPVRSSLHRNVYAVKTVNSKLLFIISPFDSYDKQQAVYRSENGGGSWAKIRLPKTTKNSFDLEDMSWLSATKGYAYYGGDAACGSEAKAIYYTDDAGAHWHMKSQVYLSKNIFVGTLEFCGDCNGIVFFSSGVGYIGGGRSGVMKSKDGGVHFSEMFKVGDSQYGSGSEVPDFINENEGYAIFSDNGKANYLEHTTDGGRRWTLIASEDRIAGQVK